MARSFATIKAAMQADIRANYPSLNNFLFPTDPGGSQVSVFNTIISVVATAIMTFEIILDTVQNPSGSVVWVQRQILNFQYGDVVTITNFVPGYTVITPANRIVTQCAINVSPSSGLLTIKVAKGSVGALSALSGAELSALRDYYFGTNTTQGIGFAGVTANFVSLGADRLYMAGTVYFYGQYVQATVQANVNTAIANFLNSFSGKSFGGIVYIDKQAASDGTITSLRQAIESVAGVSRVAFTSIKGRDALTSLGSATPIDIQQSYSTLSGYVIPEDTGGSTPNDTLTYAQEI